MYIDFLTMSDNPVVDASLTPSFSVVMMTAGFSIIRYCKFIASTSEAVKKWWSGNFMRTSFLHLPSKSATMCSGDAMPVIINTVGSWASSSISGASSGNNGLNGFCTIVV